MKKLFMLTSFGLLLAMAMTICPVIGYCTEGVESTLPQSKHSGDDVMKVSLKAVFHLDLDQEDRLILALTNIKNLFKEIPAQQCEISVVANGKAVNLFKKSQVADHAKTIEELHASGVHFKICNNALTAHQIRKEDLIDVYEIVPAGILEIINLQQKGFAYIKP
jgi:uncharacterized protein